MRLRYIGRHTGGVYVGPDDEYVPHGGEFTATGDVAKSLLDRPHEFERVEKSTPTPADDGDTTEES